MRIDIQDYNIKDFSSEAKKRLVEIGKDYINDIVDQSRSIKKADSLDGKDSQVIVAHVNIAKKNYKMNLSGRKVFFNIFWDVLLFALGMVTDIEWISKSNTNLIIYICALIFIIIITVMKHMKGR